MTTLKISEGAGVVDIDSGKRVGSIHQRECGEHYFRLSPLTLELSVDEEVQVCYILDELNGGGENARHNFNNLHNFKCNLWSLPSRNYMCR